IKREWISSYTQRRRGEALLVATVDDQPVGFLAVLQSGPELQRSYVIDLIGVGPRFQGHGVGTALVRAFISRYGPRALQLVVGTQAANIESLGMYQKCGFRVNRTAFVLHMHITNVQP